MDLLFDNGDVLDVQFFCFMIKESAATLLYFYKLNRGICLVN